MTNFLSVFPSFRLSVLTSVCFFLASCGGGGSGDSPISSNQPTSPPNVSSDLVSLSGSTEESKETESDNNEERKIVVNVQPPEESNNEEENEEIIDIIVVEQPEEEESEEEEEQQKIVVNIQPDPEEESENDQESDDNNKEQTPQQITIIEEPEPTYIPPAEEEPKYSASISSTDFTNRTTKSNYTTSNHKGVGDINGFSYWFSDDATGQTFTISQGATGAVRNLDVGGLLENSVFDPSDRGLKLVCEPGGWGCQYKNSYLFPEPDLNSKSRLATVGRNFTQNGITRYGNAEKGERYIIANYRRTNGFSGIYSYKGRSGNLVGDVDLQFKMGRYHEGFESKTTPLQDGVSVSIDGTIGNNLIMNGDNFGTIVISGSIDPKTGTFTLGDNPYSSPMPYFAKRVEFRRAFTGSQYRLHENVNSGTTSVVGSFSNDGTKGNAKAHLPNHIAGEIRMEGFYQGSDATNSQHNKLVGVFVGDKK